MFHRLYLGIARGHFFDVCIFGLVWSYANFYGICILELRSFCGIIEVILTFHFPDAAHPVPSPCATTFPLADVDPEQPSTSGCSTMEMGREYRRQRRRLIDREEFKAVSESPLRINVFTW